MTTAIRDMFASIAPRYDRANAVLSLGIHASWRRRAVALLDPRPGERVLDVCCGTGDLAVLLERGVRPGGTVIGADFCAPMVALAREKRAARGVPAAGLGLLVADALALPFPDASFDAATIAFGIRNVDDPLAALREIARLVRPGGRAVVLEFGQPEAPLLAPAYRWYSRALLPALGALLTGRRDPYEYLRRSAAAFPSGERFLDLLRDAGFRSPRAVPLAFGIAWAYRGEVAPAAPTTEGGSHAAHP